MKYHHNELPLCQFKNARIFELSLHNEELATLNENEEIVPYIHLVYHYNIQQSAMPHKRELPSCLGKDVKIGKVLLFVNDLFFFSPLTFLKSTFLDQ